MSSVLRTFMLLVVGLPLIAGCATSPKVATHRESTPANSPVEQSVELPAAEPTSGEVVPVSHDVTSVDDLVSGESGSIDWSPPAATSALSLEDLEALAMENNPSIRQAMLAASKAAGVRTQVGLKPNPEVGYMGQQIGDEGSAGQNGAYLEQTFVSADKLNWNRAVLDRDVQSLLWEADAQSYRVRTDVRLKFYDALAAQRRLALAKEFHVVATKGVEIAEKRLNALEGAKPDVLQAEIQLTEVDLIVRRAEFEFEAAWKSLVAIAGVPYLPPTELLGTLASDDVAYDTELVYSELLAASPQVQAARARVDRARTNIGRQGVQAVPNLTAQLGVGHDDVTDDAFANVQLGLPLPIHNKNQGNQQAAQAELSRAIQEVRRLELLLRAELVQAMQEYRMSRVAIERYENTIIPKAQETLDLSEQAYLAGEFDFLRVLTVRLTFFETNLEYVQYLASAAKAEARIEGMLLTGGLDNTPDFEGDDGLRDQALGGQ